ncbi:nitrate reductase molybdenum cofactor assembly chaperone [Streptomyces rimosus]
MTDHPSVPVPAPVREPSWQVQSLLLAYPDEHFPWSVRLAHRTARLLPGPVAAPLLRFLDHAAGTGTEELATEYVGVFDHKKRCCPFLTYYACGDTRKRGVALLRMKTAYAAAGLRLSDDELPDHLAVVLEFAAAEPEPGRRLLLEHRAGLELLRLALHDASAPWAHVLDSVSATLPPLAGDQRTAVARLAAEGPPEEQVGLAPFAPPSYLPDPVGGRR